MACGPITSCKIKGEKVEVVTYFIFLGSEITAGLPLRRKSMTNLDSMLKSRGITFPTKVYIVKAMTFPLVIYAYERWTVRKAEH